MWRDDRIELCVTAEILAEYRDVVHRLREQYSEVDPDPILRLVVRRAAFVQAASLEQTICADPDDDKFFAAALGGAAMVIVSRDKHLLAVSGSLQVEALTPVQFIERHGSDR